MTTYSPETDAARAPVRTPLTAQAHRAAADRIMRTVRDQGTVEAAALVGELTTEERIHVAVLLARVAVQQAEPVPPPDASPTWTADELRRCHSLHVQGYRTPWVETGNRLYQRRNRRAARARAGVAPSSETGVGRPRVAG